MGGIDAATNWPASFAAGPRKSSYQSTLATAAREKRAAALTEVRNAGRTGSKRSRDEARIIGDVEATGVRLVDRAEQSCHAADGRRQEHDDNERDRGSVEDLGRRPQLVEHAARYFVP